MSVSIQPPPPTASKKKSGLGCLGCGCGALVLIVVLLIGFFGLGCYGLYKEALSVTSTTPTDVPGFTGAPDTYNSAAQKITAFEQDLKDHKSSSLHLSGDEINALIVNSPATAQNNSHVFVTLTGNDARIQACLPTDKLSRGALTGRYMSFDSTFSVAFDISTRSLLLTPHALQIGPNVFMGPDATEAQNQQASRFLLPFFSPYVNLGLRNNPDAAKILDHARNIEVKDGELVIETD
jgi:hypothetical protein